MSPEPNYVFDNNAIVSALLFEQSIPGRAFHAALTRGNILVSNATFTELHDVLQRKKFDRYISQEERDAFLVKFLQEAISIDTTEAIRACRDAKDDKFLEVAVCGAASCLISGDQDLLVLHPFRGIPILTPAQFLESVAKDRASETPQ